MISRVVKDRLLKTAFPFNVGENNWGSILPMSKVLLYFQVAQSYFRQAAHWGCSHSTSVCPAFSWILSAGEQILSSWLKAFQGLRGLRCELSVLFILLLFIYSLLCFFSSCLLYFAIFAFLHLFVLFFISVSSDFSFLPPHLFWLWPACCRCCWWLLMTVDTND